MNHLCNPARQVLVVVSIITVATSSFGLGATFQVGQTRPVKPAVATTLQVSATSGSRYNPSGFVQERLKAAGITAVEECTPCDARLAIEYADTRGAGFLNGAVATEIQSRLVLSDPEGRVLWSQEVRVRSPDAVFKDSTSETMLRDATNEFQANLFTRYLGEWVLVKLGRMNDLAVLSQAVVSPSPITPYYGVAALQAVDILRIRGSSATPALIVALKHVHGGVRHDAATALGDVGTETAIPALEAL